MVGTLALTIKIVATGGGEDVEEEKEKENKVGAMISTE